MRPGMRPSSRDDLRSTHPQKRSQAAQEADVGVCPAVGRGTRHSGRWCDRCRDPARGPAQHRRGSYHIAVAVPVQFLQFTVAVGVAEQAAVAQPIAEQAAVALAVTEQAALAQPVQVTVALAITEQVGLAQPVALAKQVTVPESVALAGSRVVVAEQCALPEPVALAQQVQVAVALAVAP